MDIFEFWATVPSNVRVHPTDEAILARVDHRFDLRCLPTPWFGPLKTAKIVLLYLSPGLAPDFDVEFSETVAGQEWAYNLLKGEMSLPDKVLHPPAYKWWRSRVRPFRDSDDAAADIAIADITPYHSKSFADFPLLAALPSARAMISWAQDTLFPQAIREERLVLCMRSPGYWGLKPGWSSGYLFAPETNRGGHLIHNPMRRHLEELSRALLVS